MEKLKLILANFTVLIADKLNSVIEMLPLSGTLEQLEEGTNIKQRSYTPKDLHDFVASNSTGLAEKTSTVTATEINALISTGDSYTLVDSPGAINFIHLDSISMIPTSGSYFDNLNGAIQVGDNNTEINFKTFSNDDTTSIKLLGNILSNPKVNQPCTMKLDPTTTTGNTGKLKIIVRYRIMNNN